MRSPISIRGYVHPSVCPSVGPSVCKSHMSWISGNSNILTNMEQNSAKNTILYLMKENSERSMQADRQNTSDVFTPSDLFFWSSWNRKWRDTIGQNRKKLRKNSYLIINIPTSLRVSEVSERTSERRGVREWSKQCGASEQVSGVSKWTSKWPSTYISIFDYSDPQCESEAARYYILPNWSPRMSFTLKFNRLTNLVPP